MGRWRKKIIESRPFFQEVRKEYESWLEPTKMKREDISQQMQAIRQRLVGIVRIRQRSPSPDITRVATVMETLLNKRLAGLETHLRLLDRQKDNTPDTTEMIIETVPWKVLGDAARSFPELRTYLERHDGAHAGHGPVYDMGRIEYLYSLGPTHIYRGIDDLNGYLIFYFECHRAAILECAEIGNAVYVLYGSWRTLARKSKAELRQIQEHGGSARRIRHVGDWRARVRNALTAQEENNAASPRTDEAA